MGPKCGIDKMRCEDDVATLDRGTVEVGFGSDGRGAEAGTLATGLKGQSTFQWSHPQ